MSSRQVVEFPEDLLSEMVGRAPNGGSWPRVEVVRSLGADDLPLLTQKGLPRQPLAKIRHSHHEAARLMALGHPDVEISLFTGYTPVHLHNLRNDPAFQELLAHYSGIEEQKFVDVLERMRQLGLNSIDELQERLDSDPESWSKRELLELAELTILKPLQRTAGAVGGGGPGAGGLAGGAVQIAVNFVTAPESNPGKVIEHDDRAEKK
jgi:hypothetical protein